MAQIKGKSGGGNGLTLDSALAGVEVGEAVAWGNIEVFPLRRADRGVAGYALIDDLIESGEAEVTEIDEGGSVPNVRVRNESDRDALILDGLELRGAKQNRMVNLTVMAGKRSQTDIPVACVEAGRWSYASRAFASARRTVGARLRADKAQMLACSFAISGRPAVSQGAVWSRVDDYLAGAEAHSATSAFDAAFHRHRARIDESLDRLPKIDAHGAVVAVNGKIVSLDLFDAMDTFDKVWETLMRGHGLDAVIDGDRPAEEVTRQGIVEWLEQARQGTTAKRHAVPGTGAYYSIQGDGVAGGIVLHESKPVHVTLFATTENPEAWDEV